MQRLIDVVAITTAPARGTLRLDPRRRSELQRAPGPPPGSSSALLVPLLPSALMLGGLADTAQWRRG